MLPSFTLPASLSGVLALFTCCFTAPTYATFTALVSGMVVQTGRRTVCGMLVGAGLSQQWHHSRAHWFFGRARWSADTLGLALLSVIVAGLLPADGPVTVAVDDTLFRRSGRKVHAAGWCHDGAAGAPRRDTISWGNCWVVAAVVVDLPFCHRPVALPVLARLWRRGGPSRPVLARGLIETLAEACPQRPIAVVADSYYATVELRDLPAAVSFTSRLRRNAALYAVAAPVPGRPGRPRRIGDRLGTPADLAAACVWTPTPVRRYGRTARVLIADVRCLWRGVYRSRPVRVVLVRDAGRPTKTGYDLALVSTDADSPAAQIVTRYAARWSIEVAFEDAKQTTGVGQARNRTRTAVERTVPFGLLTQSLVVIWYARHGHHPDVATERRRRAPWYRTKTEPSYLDMITALRRTLIAARFLAGQARTPTPQETLAVHTAWAQAAA